MACATFRLLSSMVYTTGMCCSFTKSMRYFSVASDGSVSPAQPWNADKAAQATGLSEDAVTAFYRTLAESPRTIIWMGGCLSRYTNGLQSIRAIIALQALRDNLIGSGRGLLTMEGGKPEGEKEFVDAV